MRFMSQIIEALNAVSTFFYSVYLEVLGWVYPFWMAASFFYQLCLLFNKLAWYFSDFNAWVDSVAGKVASILSYANISSYFKSIFDAAVNAWNWVGDAYANVANIVNTWWSSTSQTVQVWIQEAKQYADSLVSSVRTGLLTLQSAWDNFKGKIPTIDAVISWWGNWSGNMLAFVNNWWRDRLLDVQGLINSAFIARGSFWSGWQEIRDKVLEFFTDPLEFLYARFTDWFLGPEV